MGQNTRVTLFLTLGNIANVVAIVLILAAMGTEKWLLYEVDRTKLTTTQQTSSSTGITARYYHTRHRGMFRECYPGNDTQFLDTIGGVEDKNCFKLMFSDNIAGASDAYTSMLALYTTFMATFLVGELLLIICYMAGLYLCIARPRSHVWAPAILVCVAALVIVLGMAFFHSSVYIEENLVEDQLVNRQQHYQKWPSELKRATTRYFKESYIAAWVGFAFAIIAAFGYSFVASELTRSRSPLEKHLQRQPSFKPPRRPRHALRPVRPMPVLSLGRPGKKPMKLKSLKVLASPSSYYNLY